MPAGEYYIEFELPTGFAVTAQNAGSASVLDNDVAPVTGRTEVFTLDENERDPTRDAGLYLAPTALETIVEPGASLPYSLFLPAIGRTQFKEQPRN